VRVPAGGVFLPQMGCFGGGWSGTDGMGKRNGAGDPLFAGASIPRVPHKSWFPTFFTEGTWANHPSSTTKTPNRGRSSWGRKLDVNRGRERGGQEGSQAMCFEDGLGRGPGSRGGPGITGRDGRE